MTTVSNIETRVNKTLIALAVTLVCSGSALAGNAAEFKTISLIKKPISLVKINPKKQTIVEAPNTENDTTYSDIARLLNELPGVFSVNRLPNDNSPLITHHSDPVTGQVALSSDSVAWSPLPFYFGDMKFITPLFFARGNIVDSSSTNGFPAVNVSSIVGQTPSIDKRASVAFDLGMNGKRGLVFDQGNKSDGFGHRFYYAKQQVDSHREFSDGESGQFDSNEALLKFEEITAVNSGKNKQKTQLTIHYKDFNNNESLIGLSDNDAINAPQHRYSATKLDNLSGDQLSVGVNHQTTLFKGEVVTTDVYYRTGDMQVYQTQHVNGYNVRVAPQILSDFEAAPSGELLIDKELIDSSYSSVGFTMDIEQNVFSHQFNLGVQYYQELLEQTTSTDTFSFNPQRVLTKQENNDRSEFLDLKSTIKAMYLKDRWRKGNWTLDSGVKYITVDDYQEKDTSLYKRKNNHTTAFNVQLDYQFSSGVSAYLGAKRGAMAPLAEGTSKLAKTNNQLVAGLNYTGQQGYVSLTSYYREFDNVLSRCIDVDSCKLINDDRTDIEISAVELSSGYVSQFSSWSLPISFNYSHRRAQYSELASSTEFSIGPNDELAFLPEQQFSFKMGAQFEKFYIGTRVQYRGEQRITFGQVPLDSTNSIEAVTLVDFTARYKLSKKHSVSLAVENALDEQYIDQAFYSGKMMGRNRFVNVNYKFNF
jgi:outer membrane receptor protein involved in Fe transport